MGYAFTNFIVAPSAHPLLFVIIVVIDSLSYGTLIS